MKLNVVSLLLALTTVACGTANGDHGAQSIEPVERISALERELSNLSIEEWEDPDGGSRCTRLDGLDGSIDDESLCVVPWTSSAVLAVAPSIDRGFQLVFVATRPEWMVEKVMSGGQPVAYEQFDHTVVARIPTSTDSPLSFEFGALSGSGRRIQCRNLNFTVECLEQ